MMAPSLKEWSDEKYGMLGDAYKPSGPSRNCITYLGHAAMMGLVDHEEVNRQLQLVMVQNAFGLIKRHPTDETPQAHDDYIGATTASAFTDPDHLFASLVYYRGSRNNWNFNNLYPQANTITDIIKQGFRFWQWRLPGQIAHYKMAAKRPISSLELFIWFISIWDTTRKNDGQSGLLLDIQKLLTAEKQGYGDRYWVKKARKAIEKRLNTSYGNNVANVYDPYFSKSHFIHPFVEYSYRLGL